MMIVEIHVNYKHFNNFVVSFFIFWSGWCWFQNESDSPHVRKVMI